MKKFYIVINKGDYINFLNNIKDINTYNITNYNYILNKYKNHLYDFDCWNSAKKWFKDSKKQHHYLIEIKLTKQKLNINKKCLYQVI